MKKTKIKIKWPNNNVTYASEGDDWFSTARKAGLEIPTGCLTGSCGACEIDVNGETIRACVRSDIRGSKKGLLKVLKGSQRVTTAKKMGYTHIEGIYV